MGIAPGASIGAGVAPGNKTSSPVIPIGSILEGIASSMKAPPIGSSKGTSAGISGGISKPSSPVGVGSKGRAAGSPIGAGAAVGIGASASPGAVADGIPERS